MQISQSADYLYSKLEKFGIQRSECSQFVELLKQEIREELVQKFKDEVRLSIQNLSNDD